MCTVVQCRVESVGLSVYSVQCRVRSVGLSVYSVQCRVESVGVDPWTPPGGAPPSSPRPRLCAARC